MTQIIKRYNDILDILMLTQTKLDQISSLLSHSPELLIYKPNFLSNRQNYPLILVAVINDNIEVVDLFLKLIEYFHLESLLPELTDPERNNVLHYASLNGSPNVLEKLLNFSSKFQLNNFVDSQNEDYWTTVPVGTVRVPICSTGGKTPLHFAAEHAECDCISLLLEHGANLNIRDYDGNTPLELAFLSGKRDSVLLLKGEELYSCQQIDEKLSKPWRIMRRKEVLQIQRERISRKKQLEIEERVKSDKYHLNSPLLLELPDRFFSPKLLELIKNGINSRQDLFQVFKKETDSVFSFDWFSEEFCDLLIQESEVIESIASSDSSITLTRPNSMNNYGLVLNQFEPLKKMIDHLLTVWINPLSIHLFSQAPFVLYDEKKSLLNSHHSFLVRYQIGEDVKLKKHRDDSELTMNICLGKKFSGGSLKFFDSSHSKEGLSFEHQKGKSLIHLGKHYHKANRIESGTRINLIIWCRASSLRSCSSTQE